jgi:hypothetical protein
MQSKGTGISVLFQRRANPSNQKQPFGTTLPRLGSRVRIPSPAPNFLEEINGLKRSSGAASCFPAPLVETGEAWGKEDRSGRTATFGICRPPMSRAGHSRQRRTTAGQNLRSRWLRVLPEMTIAFSIRFPGCFFSFFAKDTELIVQLVH